MCIQGCKNLTFQQIHCFKSKSCDLMRFKNWLGSFLFFFFYQYQYQYQLNCVPAKQQLLSDTPVSALFSNYKGKMFYLQCVCFLALSEIIVESNGQSGEFTKG